MAKGYKTGGRKAGTPNKLTRTVREAFEQAFEILQDSDSANLVDWAEKNPTEFYRLASKLIPTNMELTGANGGPVQISDTERAAKIAAILAAAKARKDSDVSDLI